MSACALLLPVYQSAAALGLSVQLHALTLLFVIIHWRLLITAP